MRLLPILVLTLSFLAPADAQLSPPNDAGVTMGHVHFNVLDGTKGRTLDHIGFEVNNLEAFCKQLEAKGVKFDTPYREIPRVGISLAYLTDPSGVYVELTEGLDQY